MQEQVNSCTAVVYIFKSRCKIQCAVVPPGTSHACQSRGKVGPCTSACPHCSCPNSCFGCVSPATALLASIDELLPNAPLPVLTALAIDPASQASTCFHPSSFSTSSSVNLCLGSMACKAKQGFSTLHACEVNIKPACARREQLSYTAADADSGPS